MGTTVENLLAAAMGENEEHQDLYPEFSNVAAKEGFSEIAAAWNAIAVAENSMKAFSRSARQYRKWSCVQAC